MTLSTLPDRLRKAIEISMAIRRQDFVRILQVTGASTSCTDSAGIYAWYRLGCYQKVLEVAKGYRPKNARDIVAISVSLAVTGSFQNCEDFVGEHLAQLRREARFAIEAARGIVKFIPSLALELCKRLPSTSELRAAAHLALGQHELARHVFQDDRRPVHADLVAGHFFLKANLVDAVDEKLAAVNEQLSAFDLSGIHLVAGGSGLCLDRFRNEDRHLPQNGPLVSIIVPAFNAEDHIRMSVASLLKQSYRNLEVIVIDDGSSDNTGWIARELAARDTRVRVMGFPRNRGVYAARNAALKEATGEFVTVHDADDFAHAQKIERQVWPLLLNDQLVFSISDLVRMSANGFFARREIYPLQRMNTSSLLFRRQSVILGCGYWEEERYGADSEYLFRLRNSVAKDRWVRLRQPLTFAADHSGSLTAAVSTGGLGQPSDPRRIAYAEAYTQRWLQRSRYRPNG